MKILFHKKWMPKESQYQEIQDNLLDLLTKYNTRKDGNIPANYDEIINDLDQLADLVFPPW